MFVFSLVHLWHFVHHWDLNNFHDFSKCHYKFLISVLESFIYILSLKKEIQITFCLKGLSSADA